MAVRLEFEREPNGLFVSRLGVDVDDIDQTLPVTGRREVLDGIGISARGDIDKMTKGIGSLLLSVEADDGSQPCLVLPELDNSGRTWDLMHVEGGTVYVFFAANDAYVTRLSPRNPKFEMPRRTRIALLFDAQADVTSVRFVAV